MFSSTSTGTRFTDGANLAHGSTSSTYATAPTRFAGRTGVSLRGMGLLIVALLGTLAFASSAQAQAPVSLGTTDSFAVLGGTTVTNTGPTVLNGDLGISPGAACTGFPSPCTGGGPGSVNGTIHSADAVAGSAQSDLTAAYVDAAGRPCNADLTGQNLGGMTLPSGVYCFSSTAGLTGTLTLDGQGNPDSVFIFQIGSDLTTAPNSSVDFINGAQSCNVFWQVGASAVLDTTTTFRGNVLALTSITANTGATVDGRLMARNGQVALQSNVITRAQCATLVPPEPEPTPGPGTTPPPGGDTQGPIVDIGGGGPLGGGPGGPGGGPNNQCPVRDFKLRISATDESGIKSVKVFLDGKLIKKSSKGEFSVLIEASRLDAGQHTIRVVARDNAGNRTVDTRRFSQCDRPDVPDFTG